MLVNKCRLYVEDSRARFSHYKSVNDKKDGNQNHGKRMWFQMLRVNRNFNRIMLVENDKMGEVLLLQISFSNMEC